MAKSARKSLCSLKVVVGVLIVVATIFIFFALASLHSLSTNQSDLKDLEFKLHDLEDRQKKVHLLIEQAQSLIENSTQEKSLASNDLDKLKNSINELENPREIVIKTPEPVIISSKTVDEKRGFPSPITFSSSQSTQEASASVLVVGGTGQHHIFESHIPSYHLLRIGIFL